MRKLLIIVAFLIVIASIVACSASKQTLDSESMKEVSSVHPKLVGPVHYGPDQRPGIQNSQVLLTEEQKEKRIPVKIEMPSFGISALIQPVALDNEGRVDTIPDASVIGWYKYGSAPGAEGNAILAGHRDWKRKKGSFHSIEHLRIGETVAIEYEDGSSQEFKVVSNDVYLLDEVPNSVMQLDGNARVTLITCTGKYNKVKGGYQSRAVVILE
ncbi:class F sortase [Paenibacillus luteus]|uniref:class F sortase n=1 Tax=Paenibacillus luteus TaxID=2545753 RepID=UPI001143784C|nr:class F sortase [Paenibacillus luteus]